MPRREIPLPPFNPDASEDSVYQTTGLVEKPLGGGKVAYVPGTGISDSALSGTYSILYEYALERDPLTDTSPERVKTNQPNAGDPLRLPPLSLLREFYTATELPPEIRIPFLLYEEVDDTEQSTVYWVDVRDQNKVKRLPTPSNATEDLPKLPAFAVVYQDEQYVIYSNGLLIKVDSARLAESSTEDQYRDALEIVETDIRERSVETKEFNVPEIQSDPIIDVRVWQLRLFIALKRTVHWSDVGNLERWDTHEIINEGEDDEYTQRTLAGSFTLDQEAIKAMVLSDRSLYLYTLNQIYRAQVSDVEVQFQVIPIIQSIDYLTGAIPYQNGQYFVSRAGIKFLPTGSTAPVIVSNQINERLQVLLQDNESVTAAIVESTSSVLWLFPARRTIIIFNTKFERWQIIEDIAAHALGLSFVTGETLGGELGNRQIGDFTTERLGDFGSQSESQTTVITENEDGGGQINLIGSHSPEYSLRVRLEKSSGRSRVVLQNVSLTDVQANPGSPAYSVRYRSNVETVHKRPDSSDDRPGFSREYFPNMRNEVRIYMDVEEVDLHFDVLGEFVELSDIVVETSAPMGAR